MPGLARAQGMVTLTGSAWIPGLTPGPDDEDAKWFQTAALFGALYIVALGTGVGHWRPCESGCSQDACSWVDDTVSAWH